MKQLSYMVYVIEKGDQYLFQSYLSDKNQLVSVN